MESEITYEGITYPNLNQLGIAVGVHSSTITSRMKNGLSLKEAIEKPVTKKKNTFIYKGVKYTSIKKLAVAFGIPTTTLVSRLKSGLSVEEALTTGIEKVTYKGVTYRSRRELSIAFNIPDKILSRRLKKGMSLEEAVEMPHFHETLKVVHGDTVYKSQVQLCEEKGIKYSTFTSRLFRGMSFEEAVEFKKLTVKDFGLTDDECIVIMRTWSFFNEVCFNKNSKNYPYYGGRGIDVCLMWRKGTPNALKNYIAWVTGKDGLGPRPTDKDENGIPIFSLDRINNDGHYEPGNLRWATRIVQNNNRRGVRGYIYRPVLKLVCTQ